MDNGLHDRRGAAVKILSWTFCVQVAQELKKTRQCGASFPARHFMYQGDARVSRWR